MIKNGTFVKIKSNKNNICGNLGQIIGFKESELILNSSQMDFNGYIIQKIEKINYDLTIIKNFNKIITLCDNDLILYENDNDLILYENDNDMMLEYFIECAKLAHEKIIRKNTFINNILTYILDWV